MKIADTFHGEVTRRALQWAIVYDRAQEVEGEDVRSQTEQMHFLATAEVQE